MLEGVDYSGGTVPYDALQTNGKKFAMRYISHDAGKDLTAAEMKNLLAHGIGVGLVFESTENRALGGRSAGVQDASYAKWRMRDLGLDDLPVYFAVDFDATEAQKPTIHSYLAGAASVLGHERVGVYGSYYVVRYCVQNNSCAWFWQTYAWSGGLLHPAAHIHQYKNGVRIGGLSCDLNRALKDDFGVRMPSAPKPPPDPKEDDVPDWFAPWLKWYVLDRKPGTQPAGVPDPVPQWAYDLVGTVMATHVELGPPLSYQSFRDWRVRDGGLIDLRPPNVPAAVPQRWWDAVQVDLACVNAVVTKKLGDRDKQDAAHDEQVAAFLHQALALVEKA